MIFIKGHNLREEYGPLKAKKSDKLPWATLTPLFSFSDKLTTFFPLVLLLLLSTQYLVSSTAFNLSLSLFITI